jgi:hypothetical protein
VPQHRDEKRNFTSIHSTKIRNARVVMQVHVKDPDIFLKGNSHRSANCIAINPRSRALVIDVTIVFDRLVTCDQH